MASSGNVDHISAESKTHSISWTAEDAQQVRIYFKVFHSQILQTAGIVESIVTHAHRVSSIETATLARVSRTFTDPALNALWRHLESFLPLLKLFSGLNSVTLECTQTEEGCLASVYYLTNNILPAEWDRFQAHIGRVRKIGNHSDLERAIIIHPSVYQQLYLKNRCMALLPHVNETCWHPASILDTELLFIVPRSLEALAIDVRRAYFPLSLDAFIGKGAGLNKDFGVQLRQMLQLTPTLRLLTVSGVGYAALAASVSTCSHLRTLRVVTHGEHNTDAELDITFLQAIQSLEYLAQLRLKWVSMPDSPIFQSYPLAALQELSIHGDTQSLERLLAILELPMIRSLYLTTYPYVRTDEADIILLQYHEFFAAVAATTLSTLTFLDVCVPEEWGSYPEDGSEANLRFSLRGLIKPLFQLKRLKKLKLAVTASLSVSPEDIRSVANAWPGLKSLVLCPCGQRSSVSSLVPFARHLPLLETLSLQNFNIDSIEDRQACQAMPHPLEHIALLGLGDKYDVVKLAKLINYLFPGADAMFPHEDSLWRRVSGLLTRPQVTRGRRQGGHNTEVLVAICDQLGGPWTTI
ncbi:hypothetical protein POSPLADRAFT_1036263 [Postia placenta MAD-698-R-SB12]|uniref:F-box domain-containing protein n=1 Tax=Postia placenta MAD-698-R-SB12 TaxID=670580 RepID=A0A1X6MQQ2_9APHY|nr:hypothetical protein POSPLADRAFT_1036263 [Postia placenta MAD-698-R-SB12]OSX58685.1 hypothetical protein POSPLADRAFT_1036263 [Postia placenta MAD-698-R-SB12]